MQLVSLDRVLGLQWLVSGVNGGFLLTMRADLHHLIQAHASYFLFSHGFSIAYSSNYLRKKPPSLQYSFTQSRQFHRQRMKRLSDAV